MNQQPQHGHAWLSPQIVPQHQLEFLQQQQMAMGAGPFFYPNTQSATPFHFAANKAVKRRPGTAGRKQQLNFGKKAGSNGSTFIGPQLIGKPASNSQIDLEVSKLRPRVIY